MPFSGSPVFLPLPAAERLGPTAPLVGLPAPLRSSLQASPPRLPCEVVRLAPDPTKRGAAALLSLLLLFSACSRKSRRVCLPESSLPHGEVARPHPEPAHSVSTLFSEPPFRTGPHLSPKPQAPADLSTPSASRVCFAPEALLSFRLQGLEPPGDPRPVSGPAPSLLLDAALRPRLQLRRLAPSGKPPHAEPKPRTGRALLAFSPLRLSFPPPWHRLPGASSLTLELRQEAEAP
jgi:hypothetical protein